MNDPIAVNEHGVLKEKRADMSCTAVENVFEKVVIVAKRARQLVERNRLLFEKELEEIEDSESNRKRQLLAKKYESMQSPVTQAIQEFNEGEIMYGFLTEEN